MFRSIAFRLINARGFSISARDCLKEGDSASLVKTITRKDVTLYADLVNDHNPVHLAEDGQGIVHGTYLLGLVSGRVNMLQERLAESSNLTNSLGLFLLNTN